MKNGQRATNPIEKYEDLIKKQCWNDVRQALTDDSNAQIVLIYELRLRMWDWMRAGKKPRIKYVDSVISGSYYHNEILEFVLPDGWRLALDIEGESSEEPGRVFPECSTIALGFPDDAMVQISGEFRLPKVDMATIRPCKILAALVPSPIGGDRMHVWLGLAKKRDLQLQRLCQRFETAIGSQNFGNRHAERVISALQNNTSLLDGLVGAEGEKLSNITYTAHDSGHKSVSFQVGDELLYHVDLAALTVSNSLGEMLERPLGDDEIPF